MRRKKRLYFVVLNKRKNTVGIFKSLAQVADYLSLTPRIIYYRMNKVMYYDNEDYSIWRDVPVNNIERGFGYN